MVTNYPQQLAAAADVDRQQTTDAGLLTRTFTRLGQVLCGMGGHDSVLHFEGSRIMMRCTSCGYDTPGWEIGGRGPRRRFDGDPRRHAMARPRLALRKTA